VRIDTQAPKTLMHLFYFIYLFVINKIFVHFHI